jgi:NADH dehydrogenase
MGATLAENKKSIVVTGSSGFIGKRLVSRISKSGCSVVSMYHHKLPDPMANVYPVCTDFLSVETLLAPIRGADTVVHLAWSSANSLSKAQKSDVSTGENLRIARNLIAACENSGIKKIVFLSALGASSDAVDPFLREKYEVERYLLQSRIPEKVIIRSSVICSDDGMNDPFLWSILRLMQFPMVYPVPEFREKIAPVFIGDLIKKLEKSIQAHNKSSFDLQEIQGPVAYSVEELFKLVQERFVKGRRLALTGAIGEKLLPFFEVDSKRRAQLGRSRQKLERKNIKSYLTLSNPTALASVSKIKTEVEESKNKYLSFAEVLKHGRTKSDPVKAGVHDDKT